MLLGVGGCGESDQKNQDSNLTEAQRNEKAKKEEQRRRKAGARTQAVLVELKEVSVVSTLGNRVALRARVDVNSVPFRLAFTTQVNGNLVEEFDLQDKTEIIRARFPQHSLEVASFRFKSGTLNLMGLELRLSAPRGSSLISASQFALVVLDPSLGDKALRQEEFEFPVRSSLDTWSRKAKEQSMNGETGPPASGDENAGVVAP